MEKYDIAIIGSGSGGYVAAIITDSPFRSGVAVQIREAQEKTER